MSKQWRGINDFYFVQKKSDDDNTQPVETEEDQPVATDDGPEVRLSEGTFLPGDEGYQFNKKCKVRVKVEYLKKTSRKKIVFKLFSIYNNEEEDLQHQAEGYEKDGYAEAEIMLFYGDKHAEALRKDPSAACEYKFKASHSKGEKEIESELLEMPQSDKKKVNVVEIPDITFNLNSAVPCLDSKNFLISSTITAYIYAPEHTDEELVVCGHTDTSGDYAYNYDLSELRAKAVKSLLENDASSWADIAQKQSKVEDYQTILKTLNDNFGWSCNPGKVDNENGPKTREGVKEFQSSYNAAFKASIQEDGEIGPETWKAIHAVLSDLIQKAYKKETGKETLSNLSFRQSDGGIYPCGESFPIDKKHKDNYKSQINRRVELVFYDKKKPPELKKPEDKGSKIEDTFCQIYNAVISLLSVVKLKEIKPEPVQKEIKLTIEYPDKSPHKQYVNLTANDKEQGNELKIKVKAENAEDKQKIYWKVTADSKNSQRNKPETGLKNPGNNKFVKIDKGEALIETEVKSESSEVILSCGLAGGDKFTIEVGTKKDKWEKKVEIENWRKLWYQRSFHKNATAPSMSTPEKQLKDVFIEFISESDVKHSNGKAGSVIVGNHNASAYHKLLNTKYKDQCVNEIFCDKQFDGLDSDGKNITAPGAKIFKKKTDSIKVGSDSIRIFDPPLQKSAKFVTLGIWVNKAKKTKGKLTDDKTKVTDDIGLVKYVNDKWIEVELPKNAEVSDKNPVSVNIIITAASGPWGGDGGTPSHNLIVINKNDTIHSQCIMHELGHLMNMVPYPNRYKCPPGFTYKDHQYEYIGMGGSGSHCYYKHDKNKSTPKVYVDGKCIMFHQLNYNCQLSFCHDCSNFVKAQTLEKFNDLG